MKHSKRIAALLLTVLMLATCMMGSFQASATEKSSFASEFAEVTDNAAKLKTRYWMPGAYAASSPELLQEIRREMKEMADAGYGGIELADRRSLTESEEAFLEAGNENGSFLYGSKNWQLVLQTVLEAARECGMQVDLTLSASWPVVSNEITPNDDAAAKELCYGTVKLPAGESFNGVIDPVSVTSSFAEIESKLEGIYAAKLVNEGQAMVIQGMFNSTPVPRVQYTIGKDSFRNITDLAAADGSISYTNDTDDEYILVAVYSRGTGQNIGGAYQYMDRTDVTAGSERDCWVVDHLSVAGAEIVTDYLDRMFTPEIKALLKEVGGYFFEDSLELKGSTSWTVDMRDEFANRAGYELDDCLPFVLGLDKAENYSADAAIFVFDEDADESVDRMRADYVNTVSDLYIDNRIATFSEWANETYDMGYRPQAYGAMVDSAKAAAVADIPEGEPLTFTNESDRYRIIAAGRDMGGSTILSNEIGCDYRAAKSSYGHPWSILLKTMNKNMAAGVNQNMLHGYSYRYSPEAVWPGYHAFGLSTAGPFDSRMPSWEHINDVTGYINRTQYVLQQGVQKTDIAIYRQEFNAAIWQKGFTEFYYDDELADSGYSYQFFSRGLFDLPSAAVTNNVLNENGPAYKAMIVDNDSAKLCDGMEAVPNEVAQSILSYAKSGLPVVIIGELPSRSLYQEDDDAATVDAFAAMLNLPNVRHVSDYSGVVPALKALGVQPNVGYADGQMEDVDYIHRQDGNADYYYFYNGGTEEKTFDVTLKGSGIPCILNTWTGEITPYSEYQTADGGYTVEVSLAVGDAMIVGLADASYFGVAAPKAHVVSASTDTVLKDNTLYARISAAGDYEVKLSDEESFTGTADAVAAPISLNKWDLTVESWTAGDNSGKDCMDTKKTEIKVGETEAKSWKEIEALGDKISGIATYTTEFTIDGDVSGALLKLTAVNDTYRIFVNGKQLPPCSLINYNLDLGDYVTTGKNTMTIEVASVLANAINSQYHDNGLIGDVTLTPYKLVELADLTPQEPSSSEEEPSSSESSTPSGDSSTGSSSSSGQPNTGADSAVPFAAVSLMVLAGASFLLIRRKSVR